MLNFLHINVAGNVSFVVKKTTMLKFFLIYFNDCTENKKKALENYSCKHKYK